MLSTKASRHLSSHYLSFCRPLATSACLLEKALPPRRKIDENEIEESFLKGSGPGGQKINKTNSAVQLKHLPTGIVVKCQDQRSRDFNRKVAREILGEKLDRIELGDKSRTAIKTERARSKKASASKKSKRKYRKLAEDQESMNAVRGSSDTHGVGEGSKDGKQRPG